MSYKILFCRVCHHKFKSVDGRVKCRRCRQDGKYVLVHDPSGTYPEHACEFFVSAFRATLAEGLWPPGSVWKFEGKFFVVRGNETLENPDAFTYPPQCLEATVWEGIQTGEHRE